MRYQADAAQPGMENILNLTYLGNNQLSYWYALTEPATCLVGNDIDKVDKIRGKQAYCLDVQSRPVAGAQCGADRAPRLVQPVDRHASSAMILFKPEIIGSCRTMTFKIEHKPIQNITFKPYMMRL